MIAVLRDPVDRAFSHYRMAVKQGFEELAFMQALHREISQSPAESVADFEAGRTDRTYARRGLYAQQLARFYDLFEPEQLLVLCFEDLFGNDGGELSRLHDCLGVPRDQGVRLPHVHIGSGSGSPMPEDARVYLTAFYEKPNEELRRLLGRELWDATR